MIGLLKGATARAMGVIVACLLVAVLVVGTWLGVTAIAWLSEKPDRIVGITALYVCGDLYGVSIHRANKRSQVFTAQTRDPPNEALNTEVQAFLATGEGLVVIHAKGANVCTTKIKS